MAKIEILVDYTDNYSACPANENIACVTTGRTLDEVKRNMEEALHFHIDGMKEDGDPIPAEFEGEWELEWNLSVRAILHATEGLVPKSAIARASGVNQQLLTHYASGIKKPRAAMRAKIIGGIHQIAERLSAIS